MKSQIEKYKIKGKVYIWTYRDNKRNYPGWNFTVDLKASENLFQLLSLMKNCEWSTQKILSTKLPSEHQTGVSNNQDGNARWESKSNLILKYNTTKSENYWKINELDNGIKIQFGKQKLNELQNAIKGLPQGKGDIAISDLNDENILYFWWNNEK